MKSVEQFLSERYGPNSPFASTTTRQYTRRSLLSKEARQAANLGWRIFPVPLIAKLNGNPDLLIGDATCDISRLEELAAEYYPVCGWRIAVCPSSLCILQLDGPLGRNSFAALAQDEGECLTLQAGRGDAAWAFFRWPKGLELRADARKLAPGVRILADGDSCAIEPFCNPWAEVEAVPYWLRDLAFESPVTPCGKAASVPPPSRHPAPCRSPARFAKPTRDPRKDHPVCGYAGGCGGFRISRRS